MLPQNWRFLNPSPLRRLCLLSKVYLVNRLRGYPITLPRRHSLSTAPNHIGTYDDTWIWHMTYDDCRNLGLTKVISQTSRNGNPPFFWQPLAADCFSARYWIGFDHGLRTPREEVAFTAWPKIHSHSQIFRNGRSIFCLPHRTNFSDIFDLCLHWVSVVRGFDLNLHTYITT